MRTRKRTTSTRTPPRARSDASSNVHEFLLNFLEENPVKDADAFMRLLSKASPEIAMRVMEVRAAYAEDDFEWQNSRRWRWRT